MITLYSTGCPNCNVLKKKIDDLEIEYELNTNVEKMIELGFKTAPIMTVDGINMNFVESINWIKQKY